MSLLAILKLKAPLTSKILFSSSRESVPCSVLSCSGARGKILEFKCGNECKRRIINFTDSAAGT
jgi:hypothetical protein